jgi:hypothetical protein
MVAAAESHPDSVAPGMGVAVASTTTFPLWKTPVRSCGLGKKREGLGAGQIGQTSEGSGAHRLRAGRGGIAMNSQ